MNNQHLTDYALARNGMDARTVFEYRRLWKTAMAREGQPLENSIDLWYDRHLHGKVNHEGDIVHLSETNLGQFKAASGDIVQGLDFVVDAFADLHKHFKMARANTLLNTSGKEAIIFMEASKGWTSAHSAYNSYLVDLYNSLVSGWFTKNIIGRCVQTRAHTITDLSSYTKSILELLVENNGKAFISKSAFVSSRFLSPLTSGLCVEITNSGRHASDAAKGEWLNDPNFQFYKSSAQNHGFMIDKNAPWRLVADINHPSMQEYMKKYGVNAKTLFQKYYYQTFRFDIDELKDFFEGSYNAYAGAYPEFSLPQTVSHSGIIKTKSRLVARRMVPQGFTSFSEAARFGKADQISAAEMEPALMQHLSKDTYSSTKSQAYPDEYWLELYYFIRLRELGVPMDPAGFNRTVRKIIQVYKHFGLDKAQEYVSILIKTTRTEFLGK